MKNKENINLFDRFAVAFFSGVISFITGLIIWALVIAAFNFEGQYVFSSFKLVLYFSVGMAIVGFLLLENIIVNLFGNLWHGIYHYLKE